MMLQISGVRQMVVALVGIDQLPLVWFLTDISISSMLGLRRQYMLSNQSSNLANGLLIAESVVSLIWVPVEKTQTMGRQVWTAP
jgi:hypothetical protein